MPVLRLIRGLSEIPPDAADDFDATASRELLERTIAFLEADGWEIDWIPSARAIDGYAEFANASAGGRVKAGDSTESLARWLSEWIDGLGRGPTEREVHVSALLFGDRWKIAMRYPVAKGDRT